MLLKQIIAIFRNIWESLGKTLSGYLKEGSKEKSTQEAERLGSENYKEIEDNYVIESGIGTIETTSIRLVEGNRP
jgi:hypothetical protein